MVAEPEPNLLDPVSNAERSLEAIVRAELRDKDGRVGDQVDGNVVDHLLASFGFGLDDGEIVIATLAHTEVTRSAASQVAWMVNWTSPSGIGQNLARAAMRTLVHRRGALITDRRLWLVDGTRACAFPWGELTGASGTGTGTRVVGGTRVVLDVNGARLSFATPAEDAVARLVNAVVADRGAHGPLPPEPPVMRPQSSRVALIREVVEASPWATELGPQLALFERAVAAGRPWGAGWWRTSVDADELRRQAATAFGPDHVDEPTPDGVPSWRYRRQVLLVVHDTVLSVRDAGGITEYRIGATTGGPPVDYARLRQLHLELLVLEARLLLGRALFGPAFDGAQSRALPQAELAAALRLAGYDPRAMSAPIRVFAAPAAAQRRFVGTSGPSLVSSVSSSVSSPVRSAKPAPWVPTPIVIACLSQLAGGLVGAAAAPVVLMFAVVSIVAAQNGPVGGPAGVAALVLVGLASVAWIPGLVRALLALPPLYDPAQFALALRASIGLGFTGPLFGDPVGPVAAVVAVVAARSSPEPRPPAALVAAGVIQSVTGIAGLVAAPATCLAAAVAVLHALQTPKSEGLAGLAALIVLALLAVATVAWVPAAARILAAGLFQVMPLQRTAAAACVICGVASLLVGDAIGAIGAVPSVGLLLLPSARGWGDDRARDAVGHVVSRAEAPGG